MDSFIEGSMQLNLFLAEGCLEDVTGIWVCIHNLSLISSLGKPCLNFWLSCFPASVSAAHIPLDGFQRTAKVLSCILHRYILLDNISCNSSLICIKIVYYILSLPYFTAPTSKLPAFRYFWLEKWETETMFMYNI